MFKRLKDRIVEEANKLPGGQQNSTPTKLLESEHKAAGNSSEDLITLSDTHPVVAPVTSYQQFSIGDDDGSPSEQSTPQKKLGDMSTNSEMYYTPNATKEQRSTNTSDMNVFQEYHPSKTPSYVPQSDIESEKEDPPTLNLDGISENQLFQIIQKLKARLQNYKNKYSEVTKSYKILNEEKLKIENTLIENQDKGLRRIAELREQCQLEQKAKAHLEENLRLMLEEKDSRISVLETQINLLKSGSETSENCDINSSGDGNSDANSVESKTSRSKLQEKDRQVHLKSDHEDVLSTMQSRLEELEQQQEESVMSMAETKKNMHEELELKEKQLVKAEEEARQHQADAEHKKAVVTELRKQHEERIAELQNQLTSTEKTLEDEKKNLMQELTRGKTAAINLMQQELSKKISATEEEWRAKMSILQSQYESSDFSKVDDVSNKLLQAEDQIKTMQLKMEESNSAISDLKSQNLILKNTIESLKEQALMLQKDGSLKCAEDKFQQIEANYITQLEELRLRVQQLEKEKTSLEREHSDKLKAIQSKFEAKIKDSENRLLKELRTKEEELKMCREKYETCNKEISVFQESSKDKENMIVKLRANLASLSKDNMDKVDELNNRIKQLEQEQEQLMLQAQERVSATEAKCREQLQEKCNQLVLESKEIERLKTEVGLLNNQLDESLLFAEANMTSDSKEISLLKSQLKEASDNLIQLQKSGSAKEIQLSNRIENLEKENNNLRVDCNQVQRLKLEKDQLNETLKSVETRLEEVENLKGKAEEAKAEVSCLKDQLGALQERETEKEQLLSKVTLLEQSERNLRQTIETMEVAKSAEGELLSEKLESLKRENESLREKVSMLEQCDATDPHNSALKKYVTAVKKECDVKEKLKEEEMEGKLKQLVKDFCVQMDVKDREYDQMVSELIEKNENVEEKLRKEQQIELSSLRQDLFEKDCAIEEMQEHYVNIIKGKEDKIKEYESTIKTLSQNSNKELCDSTHLTAEGSDWDDTWAMPEESCENASPAHSPNECEVHVKQISSMQEELVKCNSEIKELKILLRLSPPQSLVANNNHSSSTHLLPEPTELEYLKNIIYEYMMGKEPVTLAKVIAAVLRFSDVQTQQVIKKEESKHSMK